MLHNYLHFNADIPNNNGASAFLFAITELEVLKKGDSISQI
jgi:hypothetical protein